MAAPREFDVAIIGKGILRKIVLDTVALADFTDRLMQKFSFVRGEMDRLELRRVGEEPAPRNALRLFEASTRKIESTADLNTDDVRYIVGKIEEPIACGGGMGVGVGVGAEESASYPVRLRCAILEAADPTLQQAPHITLGGGIYWPNLESDTLFVRGFYAPLYESVLGGLRPVMNAGMLCHKFIVFGSPGIGKSSFGLYALLRALREGRSVVYASGPLDKTLVLSSRGVAMRNGSSNWLGDVDDSNAVLICDSVRPPVCAAFTLLVTSPKKDVWFSFNKSPGCRRLFFPVFSADEIDALRTVCFPSLDVGGVVQRYERWGGVPRYVLGNLDAASQRMLESAIGAASLDSLAIAMRSEALEEADVSHTLVHFKVRGELDEFDDNDPRLPDYFDAARTELASAYVVRRLHDEALESDALRLAFFLTSTSAHPSAAALRGNLFETHALQVLSLGGDFDVRYLSGPRAQGGATSLRLRPADQRWFFDVGEVGGLPRALRDTLLLRPKSKGFAAIDAVLQDCVFANTTINAEHTIPLVGKSRRGLTATLDAFGLGVEGDITFCWFVPHDVFPRFLASAPLTEAGKRLTAAEVATHAVARRISQCVLRMPPFVDDAGNLRKRAREEG